MNCRINAWVRIVGNNFIGPLRLPTTLNEEMYLNLLQTILSVELENLPLLQGRWCSSSFYMNVKAHLHEQFENGWISRGNDAAIPWTSPSPDLNPCLKSSSIYHSSYFRGRVIGVHNNWI